MVTSAAHLDRPEVIQTVARIMAESFAADPLVQAVFAGVAGRDELLAAHALLHTHHAARSGSLQLLDGDPRAFLIGHHSSQASALADALLNVRVAACTARRLGLRDLHRVVLNQLSVRDVQSFTWHREFVAGPHYRAKIIAIDASLRGTGAFRRLVTPALARCDAARLPAVLETHNDVNLPIYERFGFRLVRTLSSPRTPVRQYCMVRPAAAA